MSDPDQSADEYSPAETAQRRDAAILRALTTPFREQKAEPRPKTARAEGQRRRREREKTGNPLMPPPKESTRRVP